MNMTERAFVIDKQLQALLLLNQSDFCNDAIEVTSDNCNNVLSMQAIVNAIVNPTLSQSKLTQKTVNSSSKSLILYTHILTNYTNMHSAEQVAASGSSSKELLANRRGRGFTLKISHQPAPQDSANLVVSIDHVTPEQQRMGLFIHCMWQQQLYVIPFGIPIENKAQVLVSVQDKSFNAISHRESHLYLT